MSETVNILIVDDMPEKITAIEAVLEELGQKIIKAYSGREALRKLLEHDFAVVLLDVNMPDMDGFDTALLIRQRKRSEHTPIIFVTAYSDETHLARGYSLGAVDYITAPIQPEVLRTKVGVFVDLYQKTETIRTQANHRIHLAREQAARQVAEEALRRSGLLAHASHLISSSLDYDATRANIAQAFVPELADRCDVYVCEPEEESGLNQLPSDLSEPALVEAGYQALEAGRAQRIDLGRHNKAVVLPMRVRDRMLGIAVLTARDRPRGFEPADIGLAEDIASRAATALDNARLYEKIRQQERRKDEFLATLGHELRNPLAAITHASELMCVIGPTDPNYEEAQQVVRQQASAMKRLVDDLLDVSRITSGRVQLQKVRVELTALSRQVIEAMRPLFNERKHQLRVSIPEAEMFLDADPFRLEQILMNLLINAAKYTEPGGVISFSLKATNGEAHFNIADSGIGISPELLPQVFDLFTQADRSPYRAQGGLGIGLTVARGLTKLHGGQLTAHSEGLGRGAEFVVQLPLVSSHSPRNLRNTDDRPEHPISPLRILVVEDQPALCKMTVALLETLGHQVQSAYDGIGAIAAVMDFRPDLALMDIGLPDMRGYVVARRVRDALGDNSPFLVALTGYGQEEDRRRSEESGFDLHLVKPMDLDALRSLLVRVDKRPRQKAKRRAPVES